MPIVPQGSTNLAAINIPNVYVQIVPPSPLLNGVPTNIVGAVGTASWGPKNVPVVIGGMGNQEKNFGTPTTANYDMGTVVYLASQEGAYDFRCVRVTDGTDTSSSIDLLDSDGEPALLLHGFYTGSYGNKIKAVVSNGSKTGTYKLTIYVGGQIPEVFDNITGIEEELWENIKDAVNNGQSSQRGPSRLVTASAGGQIQSITITNPGTDYLTPPDIIFNGSGSGASATAILGRSSYTVAMLTSGEYLTIPNISLTIGTGASLQAEMLIFDSNIITSKGTGYLPGDVLTLIGGSSSSGPAKIDVVSTEISSMTKSSTTETGYSVGDIIYLKTTSGIEQVASVQVTTISGSGTVTGFTILNAGSFEITNPTSLIQSSVSGSFGTGITFGSIIFQVKRVVNTSLTTGNYTTLPSNPISVSGGAGTGLTISPTWGVANILINTTGSGYTSESQVVFTGGGGTGATAILTIDDTSPGTIIGATLTNPGAGYINPTVSIVGGEGTGATATATASASVSSILGPVLNTYSLVGGTDGDEVSTAILIGVDGFNRTGMYGLRKTKCAMGVLANADDPNFYSEQAQFGLSEGVYMIGTLLDGAQNDINLAIQYRDLSAVQSYAFKLMMGDWMEFNDPYNNVRRFTSTQAKIAGELAYQAPNESALNKELVQIINTEKSYEHGVYSDAELSALFNNGIDVVTRGIPASDIIFGSRLGINTSGNPLTWSDSYTRMINFLAQTIVTGMGRFVGLPQTEKVRLEAKNTIQSFLQNLVTLGWIGDVNGGPAYRVILDATNNPSNRVAQGFMQCDVQIVLTSIIFDLVINLDANQNTVISVTPPRII